MPTNLLAPSKSRSFTRLQLALMCGSYTLQSMNTSDIRIVAEDERFRSTRGRLVVTTYETPEGLVERPVLRHPGAVAIIAENDQHELLMVRQYRYPTDSWTWEIPAGTRSPDESALLTAQRELAEEAGCQAQEWEELNSCFPAIGISDESLTFFRAQQVNELSADEDAEADYGEFVSAQWFDAAALQQAVINKEICDAKTLLALFMIGYEVPTWSRS